MNYYPCPKPPSKAMEGWIIHILISNAPHIFLMFNPEKAARKELAALPKTVHGGQGWKLEEVEDYSHNLNPFGPPEDISELLAAAGSEVHHYPDDSCSELKEAISKVYGVKTDNITVGAGSSDIIRNFPNTFIDSGEIAVIPRPSFAEYAHQCRIAGVTVRKMELSENNDLRLNPEDITRHVSGAKALYICNPNNPTGRIEPREKILSVVKECLEKDVMVFLDETLLELVPGQEDISCVKYVDKYPNLVVAGSLTKSFAIPGIRIGFGFGSPETIAQMEKVRMTWNVGYAEQSIAKILIEERMDYVYRAAELMARESVTMNRELSDVGFTQGKVSDSFFYFRPVSHLGVKASEINERMQKEGIILRDCASFGEPYDMYVRYSVKDCERNNRFIYAAESVVKSLR